VAERYFEIVVTGRQLAGLIAGIALLIVAAFGLGVGVGLSERAEGTGAPVAIPTPAWEPVGSAPPPVVETILPEETPTAVAPTATPEPQPTATPRPQPTVATGRWVQVGAVSRADQAEGIRQRTVALGFKPAQVVVQATGGKYRVRLGPFPDEQSARRVAGRLQNEGFPGAFVVAK
jgi:cell division protein FtsN